jgi:Uma2 family endonuclease
MPEGVRLAPQTTLRLAEDTFLEPDFVFYPTKTGLVNLHPDNVLLTVEVADSSLSYDLDRKVRLCAGFGIRGLWVVNAVKLVAHIHRRPGIDGYREEVAVLPEEAISPLFAPELAVTFGSLKLV